LSLVSTGIFPRTYTRAATQLHEVFHGATPLFHEASPVFHASTPILPRGYTGIPSDGSQLRSTGCSHGGVAISTELHHVSARRFRGSG